jgi:hypothetical protein
MENENIFDVDLRDFHNESDTGNIPIEAIYQAFKSRMEFEQGEGFEKLAAEQALKIRELTKTIHEYRESLVTIRNIIYCCSGPLNGNKLGYTKEQMKDFAKIADLTAI